MATLDYNLAERTLEETFAHVEASYVHGEVESLSTKLVAAYDLLFSSKTQAYREVLVGCIIAKLQNSAIDVRLPYVQQGQAAYSGRSLDERVINPFLQRQKIPCSKGPFLSVFRRSVKFDVETRTGLRDQEGFDAMLSILQAVETSSLEDQCRILRYHLYRFILLREACEVRLVELKRVSLTQCETLISQLLNTQSGGRFPVFLVVATLAAIKQTFNLSWTIELHGINVTDKASGACGDITIIQDDEVVLAVEVTERSVDASRVVSTFETKIAPSAIEDYLFFVKDRKQALPAMEQARQYFSQGYEVNFVEIKNWILAVLSLLGKKGRIAFMDQMRELLSSVEVPTGLKIAWNNILTAMASGDIRE